MIDDFKSKVIKYTFLACTLISIIGYFLSRFFLQPIANERERMDRFIKDTTHELNTPITALILSTSTIKSENKKTLDRINLSAKRISDIYNDLCYLLKNDTNNNNKEKIETIELKSMVLEQLKLLEPYANSKNITINSSLEDLNYKIDKESCKRLLNNIFTNALKYSRPNTTINISLKNSTLKVNDEGIGIQKEDLKNITKRYYRASNFEGGFGIGLDIVNIICKRYHIKFNIDSQKDKGTTVELIF